MSLIIRLFLIFLVFSKFQFTLIENAHSDETIEVSDNEKLKTISAFLKAQKRLRIVIESPSRGLGHQSSNIRLMKRLRELGFKGIFEVYVDLRFQNDKKLKTLIEGYTNKGVGTQTIKNDQLGNLEVITVSNIEKDVPKTSQPLTLIGAYDGSLNSNIFSGRNFVLLQPMEWLGSRLVSHGDNHIFLDDVAPNIIHHGLMTTSEADSSEDDLFKRGLKQLAREKEDITTNNKHASLKWLETQLKNFTVLTTYSMTSEDNATNVFDKTIEALKKLEIRPKKPILIISLDNFSQIDNEKNNALCKRKDVSFLDLTNPLSKSDRHLWSKNLGQVNFVQLGSVPPDLFFSLLLKSDLPPYIEGQNSKDFMFRRGLPFLNTSGGLDLDYFSRMKLVEKDRAKIRATTPDWVRNFNDIFFKSNARDVDVTLLTDFYSRSLHRDSEIYEVFRKFAQPSLNFSNDPVAMGLWEYMNISGDREIYNAANNSSFFARCIRSVTRLKEFFKR